MIGKVIRIGAIAGIIGLIVAVIVISTTGKPNYAEKVWDSRTTMGNAETAEHHFVMYTDVMCPYCDVISRMIMQNEEEFKRDYIEAKNVLFEVRVTDFLYEYGSHQTNNSREGAEALYCARNQDKFWDYYHAALKSLWDNYQSKGIGSSSKSKAIGEDELNDAYWIGIGESVGLGDEFKKCYTNHEMVTEIQSNTERASKIVESGLPYMRLGNHKISGFDPSWGWSELRGQFDKGLSS
ncbi:thioredoxin domain-containing protein [Candidatus Saccharibacteria bacterium]|nr:thioredoxin domain-containing protein [Candidatus Saccharibacteria bacterium]